MARFPPSPRPLLTRSPPRVGGRAKAEFSDVIGTKVFNTCIYQHNIGKKTAKLRSEQLLKLRIGIYMIQSGYEYSNPSV
jgi:hypothetical protein